MSLYFQLVFAMLVFEMSLFLLMLVPLPLSWRSKLLKTISKSSLFARIKYVLRILFVFVLILFVDSVMSATKTQTHEDNHHSEHGSVLFLSLVLDRFYSVLLDLVRNEERSEVLKTQAAKTSKEYLKILDSQQEYETKMKGMEEAVGNALKAGKELEIVKKQAAQTAEEYMRLTDKYVALEKKMAGSSENKKGQ